jgi:hypothetical protein
VRFVVDFILIFEGFLYGSTLKIKSQIDLL